MHSAWNEKRKTGLFSWEGSSLLNILHRNLPMMTQNTLCMPKRTLSCSPFGVSETEKLSISERPTLLRLDSQGETVKGECCESSRHEKRQQGIARAIFSSTVSSRTSSSNTSASLVRNAWKYTCAKYPSHSYSPMAAPVFLSHSYGHVNLMLTSIPCSRPLPNCGKEHAEQAEDSPPKSHNSCDRMSMNCQTTSTAVVQYRAQHQTISQISSPLVTDVVHGVIDTVMHVGSKQPIVRERMVSDPVVEHFIHFESCLTDVLESCMNPDIFPDWVLMLCNSSLPCQTDDGAGSLMLSLPTNAVDANTFHKCCIATKRHCRKRPAPRYPCRLKRFTVSPNSRQKMQSRKICFSSPTDSDSGSVMSDCDIDDVDECPEASSYSPCRRYEMSHLCESVAAAMVCLDVADDELTHWDRHCVGRSQPPPPCPSTAGDLSLPPLFSRQDSSSFASSFVFCPSDMSDDDEPEDDGGHDDWESSGFSSPSSAGCRHEMPDVDEDVEDYLDLVSCQFGGLFIATSIPVTPCSVSAPNECSVDDEKSHWTCSGSEVKQVNPRIERLNSQWNAFYEEDADVSTVDFSVDCSRTVHFCQKTSLVTVLNQLEWADDYEAARRGPWEEFARDRDRFERRVHEIADQICWVFAPEHRARKLRELSMLPPLP